MVRVEHFFGKRWPQEELDGLFTLETAERKIIIPIWHNVTEREVREYSPILASRFASVSEQGIDAVVAQIKKAVAFVEREKEVSDPLKDKFAAINKIASLNQKFEQLSRTEQGANLVREEVSNLFSILETKIADVRGALPFPVIRDRFQPESFIMIHGSTIRETDGSRKTLTLRFDIQKVGSNSVAEATLHQRIYFELTSFFREEFRGIGMITEQSYSPFFTESDQVVWLNPSRAALSSDYIVTQALSSFADFVQTMQEGRDIPSYFAQPAGYVPPT